MSTGACVVALAVAVGVPAASGARPSSSDHHQAAKTCKALRTASGDQAFARMFGGRRNAYGKCVSKESRENATETSQAQSNAARQCRSERSSDAAAFQAKYGSNGNGHGKGSAHNAFGKCVSQHAHQNQQQADQQDQNQVNAAKQCKSQQSSDGAAFSQKWGSGRNAFGKCVSSTARQMNQQDGQGGAQQG